MTPSSHTLPPELSNSPRDLWLEGGIFHVQEAQGSKKVFLGDANKAYIGTSQTIV